MTRRLRGVCGGLDAGNHPDQTWLPVTSRHELLEAVDVVEVVDDHQADAVPDGESQFLVGLRVAVQHQPRRVDARPQGGEDLAAAGDVEMQALLRPSSAERRCTGTTSTRRRHRNEASGCGRRPDSPWRGDAMRPPRRRSPGCRTGRRRRRGGNRPRRGCRRRPVVIPAGRGLRGIRRVGGARAGQRSACAPQYRRRPWSLDGSTVGAAAQNRRARVAVAALFLTNGAIFANLLPRYPEIKADLQLSNAVYGVAIAAFSAGALVAGLAAATLIRRFRSARVAVVGTIGIAVFVFVAALAPSAVALAAALFVAGASDAITDVGTECARRCACSETTAGRSSTRFTRCGRRAPSSAALMGAAAIALHIPRTTHLAVSAARVQRGGAGRLPVPVAGPRPGRPSVGAGRGGRATRFRQSTPPWSRWWSSRSPAQSSRTREVLGRHCICGTASARPARSPCSVTSRWSASCSSGD